MEEVDVARISIDIDAEALAGAAQELGTKTKVETVNRALAEVASRGARLAFLEHMRTTVDDLGDAEVMAPAWK